MLKIRAAWLPSYLLLAACADPTAPPGGSFSFEVNLPNGTHVSGNCAPIINFNALSVRIGGIDIPISKTAGVDIKVGTVNLDQTTLRQASDLIETLDNAQFSYCRTLPFVRQEDILKMWQDFN